MGVWPLDLLGSDFREPKIFTSDIAEHEENVREPSSFPIDFPF